MNIYIYMCVCVCVSKYLNKTLQPAMGHRLDTSEQAGEQMPMPVRCDAQKGSRSEVLPEALGRSSKQREPPRNPAQESYGAERKGGYEREASGISSVALRPLCARYPSSSSSSSFYSSRRSRSAFNSYLPYLTTSILLGT